MDPKECLMNVETLIYRARALNVTNRDIDAHKRELLGLAGEHLRNYHEWRKAGGYEPTFPDMNGDAWAKEFADILRSYGIIAVIL